MNTDWISKLSVGDKVIVRDGGYSRRRWVDTVSGFTPTGLIRTFGIFAIRSAFGLACSLCPYFARGWL